MYIEIAKDFYKILHPRPVYLIVSGSREEVNLMSASWVMPVSEEPWTIGLALDRETYTYELIKKYKEFTVNVVDDSMVDQVWIAGTKSGYDVDKIKLLNIRLNNSRKIAVPWIDGVLAYIGCKVDNTYDVGEVSLIIGKVVEAYADNRFYNIRYGWDLKSAKILMHNSGRVFTFNSDKWIYPKK